MPGSAKVHDDRLGGDPGETRHALGVLLITLTIVDLEGDMNQMNKRSVHLCEAVVSFIYSHERVGKEIVFLQKKLD
jgi:hypothetical protein